MAKSKTDWHVTTIKLPTEYFDVVKKQAVSEDRMVSAMIRILLIEALKARGLIE